MAIKFIHLCWNKFYELHNADGMDRVQATIVSDLNQT